ncbi:MAG: glycerophosphodiester phosphodiesterase, partial [Candidatus Dadabacteria bacterium]
MLIIGHRGLARVPENTLAAFKAAYEEGADGIEFDVIEGVDDFFVFHDEELDEKTTGKGPANLLTKEIARNTFYKNTEESIPTLEEVLEEIIPLNFSLINL